MSILALTAAAAAAPAAGENPYGLMQALEQGGIIAWSVFIILVGMSVFSFYILFTKWFEQSKVMRQAKDHGAFWKAASLREGANKLEKNSAWRQIVDDGILAENRGPLSGAALARLFTEIMSACRALEDAMTVAFLGPQGTFSQEAVVKHFGGSTALAPCAWDRRGGRARHQGGEALRRRRVHAAVEPVEVERLRDRREVRARLRPARLVRPPHEAGGDEGREETDDEHHDHDLEEREPCVARRSPHGLSRRAPRARRAAAGPPSRGPARRPPSRG